MVELSLIVSQTLQLNATYWKKMCIFTHKTLRWISVYHEILGLQFKNETLTTSWNIYVSAFILTVKAIAPETACQKQEINP